jgi:hypothetical protein
MFRLKHLKSLALLLPASFIASLCIIASPLSASAQQTVAGVQIFPANAVWNTKIDGLPVHVNSSDWVDALTPTSHFHPDWGSPLEYGIPYNVVQDAKRALRFYNVSFDYDDESDAGPYPVSKKLKIEGNNWNLKKNGGDRHVLMIHPPTKTLYELYYTRNKGSKYFAGSGAIFHLDSNSLRPNTWTSADAAGLPIFPLLVNYDEAASGTIHHALRFTGRKMNGYIWPARHLAGTQTAGAPPFGARFRLKASFNTSSFSATNKAILNALKEYGMFYCDGGSNWYVTGASDPRWNDDDLNALKALTGNDFEAVDESSLMVNPDSAATN